MCCEYPNISVEILPEQRVRIAVDGWDPKQYTASYVVDDDGKIALVPDSAHPMPSLQGDEVTQVYVVSQRAPRSRAGYLASWPQATTQSGRKGVGPAIQGYAAGYWLWLASALVMVAASAHTFARSPRAHLRISTKGP
jgi:hypothetical protein